MISLSAAWAIVVRHLFTLQRELNILLMFFYWPVLDVLIWGFLGSWVQSQASQLPNFETAALLGILLWAVVGRGCNIIIFSFSEELWTNNLLNLFSAPLRLIEWILGSVLFYLIVMLITSIFCMLFIIALYNVSFLYFLKTFLIFLPPLVFCAFWLGFTCLQIIVTFGKRGVELGYVIAWFLLPFSGAYYPLEVLPSWGQKLSSLLPMSYVFESMRNYVMHQQDPTRDLIIGYALSILYAALAIALFVYCFNRSKHKGLARLVD